MYNVSSPMLSPCHCPGSCPVLTLWGTNPKFPGLSRPLSPAKSRFTHCYSFLICCHPKTLLKQLSGITVTWKRVQISTQKVICFADLCLLAASTVGLSGPSRHPQGQERPPGGVAGAPHPQQVRATGKVREWESQERGGEEIRQRNSRVRRANSGCADRTTQLLPHFPDATCWSLQARPSLARLSLARVSSDFSRDPGLPLPAPQPATSRKRRRWHRPPYYPTPRGFRRLPAQRTPTQGFGNALARTRAPTHRGASLAFPRVPMATAVLLEPPHLARRDGSAGCSSSPPLPPPARPYALGLFTSGPPTRSSRAGRARSPRTRRHKLYVRAPSRSHPLARAHSQSPARTT